MAPGEDIDSGMESQESQSQESQESTTKEFTPDKSDKPELESPYDDEPDETLGERLLGLTEMFPDSFRKYTYAAGVSASSGIKNLYSFSRTAFWVVFSSSIILFAPVIFEVERAQMEELQRTQQKQMLLGPNAALSSGMTPLMQPLHR